MGAVGIFSYKISKSTAKPSFQKHSLRLLGHKEDNLPSDVSITYNGTIVQRLTKVTLIFWNNGTEMLNGEDIVKSDPLKIKFSEGSTILSYKILKITKETNSFCLSKVQDSQNEMNIEFTYLDPMDGATIEILHDAEERYPKINGTIKGLPKGFEDLGILMSNHQVKSNSPLNLFFSNQKLILWIAVFVGLSMTIFASLPEKFNFFNPELDPMPNKRMVIIIMGAIYAILPSILLWYRRAKHPRKLSYEEVGT